MKHPVLHSLQVVVVWELIAIPALLTLLGLGILVYGRRRSWPKAPAWVLIVLGLFLFFVAWSFMLMDYEDRYL